MMRGRLFLSVLCLTVLVDVPALAGLSDLLRALQPSNMVVQAQECGSDAVMSGSVCMDKYEASVWTIDQGNPSFDQSISSLESLAQSGDATLSQVNSIPGIKQLGLEGDDFLEAGCADNGAGCLDIFAFSFTGAFPSSRMTWFQASAACRNSGKRLPSNAEWQAAALGTPDAACNVAGTVGGIGNRPTCVSDVGVFDMVGNLWEWTADWVPRSACTAVWSPSISSNDIQCLAGAAEGGDPGAMLRGGSFGNGGEAGVYAIIANRPVSESGENSFGLRCTK